MHNEIQYRYYITTRWSHGYNTITNFRRVYFSRGYIVLCLFLIR